VKSGRGGGGLPREQVGAPYFSMFTQQPSACVRVLGQHDVGYAKLEAAVGQGGGDRGQRRLAELGDGVRLSGYLEDIRPVVAGASVCVAPIRQGGGTRLKILEAMALGTPVVATSKGAEGLDVADGEHILIADGPAEFANRTLQLLRDPALRQRLAYNARRLVEEWYDWGPIGQRFVRLVEEAVQRHASGESRRR